MSILAFMPCEKVSPRRQEFQLMSLACEIAYRLKDVFPRPELLAGSQILTHLFCADRCHGVKKYCGDPYNIEHICKDLRKLVFALLARFECLCHVLACASDVAVKHIGALVEGKA